MDNNNNILTSINSISSESYRGNTVSDLLQKAKTGDSFAFFKLGMLKLCENRIGFALILLRNAAKYGHARAQLYLDAFQVSNRSIAERRQHIIQLEAQYILFGDFK